MRNKLLMLTLLMGTLSLHAEDYTYLTFETTDGAKLSVSATSLTLSISGTTLTAGDQSFILTNLSKMYFSTANETTGIETIQSSKFEVQSYYDLHGRQVTKDQLLSGQVYIVKTTSGTHKIVVK